MLTSRPVTVYKAAVFVSAFLTFSMQPLVAKRLLPVLGGAPAVWNTCLLFFQLMLLAGYLLADRTVRVAPARQRVLHPLLLALAGACLPLWLRPVGEPPAAGDPALWLLGHLALTVGVPFLVLCSNTTVVQSWYARRSAAERDQAYTLYRWSNAGSLLGLLAYPVLVEPTLTHRTAAMGVGDVVRGAGGVDRRVRARDQRHRPTSSGEEQPRRPLRRPLGMRARWVVLAFVPSSFTISVTSYITSDLAAVPLLWVVPLALYLFSFVLAFGAGRRVTPAHAAPAVRVLALVVTVMYFAGSGSAWWLAGITNLVFLLAVCLLCHGRLSDLRPDAGRLSTFYLWLAVGGALGGIFNALVAPHLFHGLAEYPLGVMMAGFLLPARGVRRWHASAAPDRRRGRRRGGVPDRDWDLHRPTGARARPGRAAGDLSRACAGDAQGRSTPPAIRALPERDDDRGLDVAAHQHRPDHSPGAHVLRRAARGAGAGELSRPAAWHDDARPAAVGAAGASDAARLLPPRQPGRPDRAAGVYNVTRHCASASSDWARGRWPRTRARPTRTPSTRSTPAWNGSRATRGCSRI